MSKPILTYPLLRQKLKALWVKSLPVTQITAAFPLRRHGCVFYIDVMRDVNLSATSGVELQAPPTLSLLAACTSLSSEFIRLEASSSRNLSLLDDRLLQIEQQVRTKLLALDLSTARAAIGIKLTATVI